MTAFDDEPNDLAKLDMLAKHARALLRHGTPVELIGAWQYEHAGNEMIKWQSHLYHGAVAMLKGDNYPPCEIKEL